MVSAAVRASAGSFYRSASVADCHIVSVNDEDIMVVQLNRGVEAIIDTSAVLPDELGTHRIFAFVTINPFGDSKVNRRHIRSNASDSKLAIKAE